jgi:hypothetical protein
MALYNEILVGRYNRFLQKLFGMKGPASVRQLASELQPALSVFHGAENRNLEGWDRYGVALETPQVAAQFSGIALRNPAGSNVIAVVEKIAVSTATISDACVVGNALTTDLTTVVTGVQLDKRGRVGSTCVPSSGSSAALPATNAFLGFKIGVNLPFDFLTTDIHELPLLPGDGILVKMGAVSEEIRGCFLWRERFLEDGERT